MMSCSIATLHIVSRGARLHCEWLYANARVGSQNSGNTGAEVGVVFRVGGAAIAFLFGVLAY